MSKQYDDTNRGALFKNNRKDTDKHPDYNGSINVAGHDYWLSAWLKTDRNGRKFMSLSVKQKDGKPAPKTELGAGPSYSKADTVRRIQESQAQDMDDEIPF